MPKIGDTEASSLGDNEIAKLVVDSMNFPSTKTDVLGLWAPRISGGLKVGSVPLISHAGKGRGGALWTPHSDQENGKLEGPTVQLWKHWRVGRTVEVL